MSSADLETTIRKHYAEASQERNPALCCPVEYDPQYLKAIPQEVLDRDYGCGNPSEYLKPGETVLDLGSGGGKICFIASQVVGREGKVIGVDFGEEMLGLARGAQPQVAQALGFDNVEFRRGRIQDLALDLDLLGERLARQPVRNETEYLELEELTRSLRRNSPLVESDSIDVVVSNCVLNLVVPEDKPALFREIHRVLKRGGRAVISDIVSDETVPAHLLADGKLFSDCVSGAMREDAFLDAFAAAGLYGIEILKREEEPFAVVEGIQFYSVTVQAYKGKEGPCLETHKAVTYKGPWKAVMDDDGHTLYRGRRMAVCDKTYDIYTRDPYASQIVGIEPLQPVPLETAAPFDCTGDSFRPPRVTKGEDYQETVESCGPGCC